MLLLSLKNNVRLKIAQKATGRYSSPMAGREKATGKYTTSCGEFMN